METNQTLLQWKQFCNSQGLQKEAQAARLGLSWVDYKYMIEGQRNFPAGYLDKMTKIIEGRDILNRTVLQTVLLKEMEKNIQRCFGDKLMITLAAPTGQGKTISAKYLAGKYNCCYIPILTDLQKRKTASVKNFIRDICHSYNISDRVTNTLRHLINKLQSDTRSLLIIDESQRLISEDWGYFKVLQDLLDNVPTLSILLLGNYKFYSDMFTTSNTTYQGVGDEEQFLRRISAVRKLPRLTKSDVKLWAGYNNIPLSNSDHKMLADYFSHRAALSDLENVRKDLIRLMGKGKLRSWKDVNASVMISVYKRIHTTVKEIIQEDLHEEESFGTDQKVA